jgi:hypothetical protein
VLLLLDIVVNFQSMGMASYGLDPLRFFSIPSFSLQAALKFSKVKLELISDPTQYLFWDSGKRGGIVFTGNREAHSNDPILDPPESYRPDSPRCHTGYFDATVIFFHFYG